MDYRNFLNRDFKNIFVDYDSTLYLWGSSFRDSFSAPDWFHRILFKHDVWSKENLNKVLIEYLYDQKQRGSIIHLVTQADVSLEGKRKFDFVNIHYRGLLDDWYAVSDYDSKVTLMDAFNKVYGDKRTMLLIDDRRETIDAARFNNYYVETPQYVMGAWLSERGEG